VKTLQKNKRPYASISKAGSITEKMVRNIAKRNTIFRKRGSGRKSILVKRDKLRILSLIRTNFSSPAVT